MNQSDIFRLLLLVLLLANRQLAPSQNADDEDNDGTAPFNYTLINDVLILVMITQLFCNPDADSNINNTTF